MAELQMATPPPQELKFLCDMQDLEEHIARLGEIVRFEIPSIPPMTALPDYVEFQEFESVEYASAPGELNRPRGVSIEAESGHIYVAEWGNGRIQIFSETGEYLNKFRHEHLKYPWGILIHLDSIYVTDSHYNAIFLFRLSDLSMIKQVGKKGSGSEEFISPRQLAISPSQELYVPDQCNNRLQILSTNLDFQSSLQHQTMTTHVDVKFTNDEIFVLSFNDNPCIHVFTLSREKSRSLVTRGYGRQVKGTYFFCLDGHSNIVVSDELADMIKVFSPEGNFLHMIGQHINTPYGIGILKSKKIICVSGANNVGVQIFCS